jgi:hypothetical protein
VRVWSEGEASPLWRNEIVESYGNEIRRFWNLLFSMCLCVLSVIIDKRVEIDDFIDGR